MKKLLFGFLLSLSTAFAQLKEVDKAALQGVNILKNAGFENGLAQWGTNGGVFELVTSGANLGFGNATANWDSSGNGQSLTSTQVNIPKGLYGANCLASFFYKTAETTMTWKVIDGSLATIVGPKTLPSAANFTQTQIAFTCPTSGSLAIRFTSAVGNSAIIYLDNLFLGSGSLEFPIIGPNGSAAAPTYSFIDPDNGMYSPGSNSLALAAGGSNYLTFASSQILSQMPFVAPDGTLSLPAFAFSSENPKGFFSSGGGSVSLVSANASSTILLVNPQGANANAGFRVVTAAGGSGDAYINFAESGSAGDQWTLGRDDSDSGSFVLGQSSSALGTNTFLKATTAGALTLGAVGTTLHTVNGQLLVTGTKTTDLDLTLENTNNANAAADATLMTRSGGASGGDAVHRFQILGVTDWSLGIDNSDSDSFKLSASSALGSSDKMIVGTAATSGVQLLGSSTNDSATAGFVGEYKESLVSVATNIIGATGAFWDATSLSLTPGDWDVTGFIRYTIGTGVFTSLDLLAGITSTSGNSGTGLLIGVNSAENSFGNALTTQWSTQTLVVPSFRISLSATTTYYLKANVSVFTSGNPQYLCRLSARRVR